MNTERRNVEKESKREAKVIGNLSIIVGPNRRGDIVVREGDDLKVLVKNFIALYGLKREVAPTVLMSLQQLVEKNKARKGRNQNNQPQMSDEKASPPGKYTDTQS